MIGLFQHILSFATIDENFSGAPEIGADAIYLHRANIVYDIFLKSLLNVP